MKEQIKQKGNKKNERTFIAGRMPEHFTSKNVLKYYGVSDKDIKRLYEKVLTFVKERGVHVIIKSLENAIEFKKDLPTNTKKHHETCVSDGQTVYLHNNLHEVGGLKARLYDLLHVGIGHYSQWNAFGNCPLKFSGNGAWETGQINFMGSSEKELSVAKKYEREASWIYIENLKTILSQINSFSHKKKARIIQFYTDYAVSDLKYLMTYYRTGKVRKFYDSWIAGNKRFPRVNLNFTLKSKRRNHQCIPLINSGRNK